MLTSFQRHAFFLLDVLTLNVQAIITMHAASVALLLHGILLASLAGLIIKSSCSAQTILLIGLLLNIHPRLLSYIQIPSSSIQELSYPVDVVRDLSAFREEQIQKEVVPQSKDCRSDEEHSSHSITVPAEKPHFESPTKLYLTRCKNRKPTRERGTSDEDKENEPSPLRFVASTRATPTISHQNGLRPLTLTNLPMLDAKDTVTPKRPLSSCSNAKRQSPSIYLSDGRQQQFPPVRSPGEVCLRSASLPPNCFSHTGTDVTPRMQGETQLTSRLEEEMRLTARLRNDWVELRDRACAELNQSKHLAQALAVAVDTRERFIKDLAASVELLRVENKVLKKVNGRELSRNVFTKTNVNEDVQPLSPKIKTERRGKDKAEVPNIGAQRFGCLKSVHAKKVSQRCCKRSRNALRCISGIGENLGENNFCRNADWFSTGSISEPILEPRCGRDQISPPTSTADNAEFDEYTESTSEVMEVQFPTISPELPLCRAAVFGHSQVAYPPSGAVIYEANGRNFASTHEHLWSTWELPNSVGVHTATSRPRDSPHRSVNDPSNVGLTLNEACYGEGGSLAMQRDSPFYAVPASAFILPRAMGPVSVRRPSTGDFPS